LFICLNKVEKEKGKRNRTQEMIRCKQCRLSYRVDECNNCMYITAFC